MRRVNVATCELDWVTERGAFGHHAAALGEQLGAATIGAADYELADGQTCWPYHHHHGVEEWMYVVAGAPVLRDPGGERTLRRGELVAFADGPSGAHTVRGPGRVVIFSAGWSGWRQGRSASTSTQTGSAAPPG